MRASLLAERYAIALGKTLDPASLEEAGHALSGLSAFYKTDPHFRHALANPTHPLEERHQLLDVALKSFSAPETVARWAHMLLDRNRITLLLEVATRFDAQLEGWLNRVEATIVSAVPMTTEQETRVSQALEHFARKRVRIKKRVDANLIGGFEVHMWGVLFDVSIRTQLARLREKLLSEEN